MENSGTDDELDFLKIMKTLVKNGRIVTAVYD